MVQLESVKEKLLADQFCYLQLWDPIKAKPCKIKILVEFGVKIIAQLQLRALYFNSDFEGAFGRVKTLIGGKALTFL